MTLLHLLVYLSLLIFIAAVLARIIRISRMPIHLRWELYPVPHEKSRAHYGGSRLEEPNWWTKPAEHSRWGDLSVMIPEILFLKGVWEHNRSLWFGSWALHFGLYLLIGVLGLLLISGASLLAGLSGGIFAGIPTLVTLLAWAGCGLGFIGAVVMLFKRIADPNLRPYNNASHFFNLAILGGIYITGIFWLALHPDYAESLAVFFAGWMSASSLPALPAIGYWHLGFALFFLIYFPFTHMTHAFVKYFTYHDVRWEDQPNLPGGKLQPEILKLESQVVTWAAPHVGADGKKTWLDIVSETGEEKK